MKTKEEITANWLPRYTGLALEDFSQYILLTNFTDYLHRFVEMTGVTSWTRASPWPARKAMA